MLRLLIVNETREFTHGENRFKKEIQCINVYLRWIIIYVHSIQCYCRKDALTALLESQHTRGKQILI